MTWHGVGRAFRWTAIIALSLAALIALVAALVTLPQALRRHPMDLRLALAETHPLSQVPRPILENERYSLWANVSRCCVTLTYDSKRCLECGQVWPNHSPNCFFSRYRVDPHWYSRVDKQLALPGFQWRSGVCIWFRFTEVRLSLWLIFVVLALYPTAALAHGPWRRYRRRKRGLCAKCGYDLRASPDRCPECGTPRPDAPRNVMAASK